MIKLDAKMILLLFAVVSLILIINKFILDNPLKDVNNTILEGLAGGSDNGGKCEENSNQNYQFRSAVSSQAVQSVKNFDCSSLTDIKSCNSNINCIWKNQFTGINDNFSIIGIKKSKTSGHPNQDLANFGQIEMYNFFGGQLGPPQLIPNPDTSVYPHIILDGNLMCPQLFVNNLYAIGLVNKGEGPEAALFTCGLTYEGDTVKAGKWYFVRIVSSKQNEYIPSLMVLGILSKTNHLYAGLVFKPNLQISIADISETQRRVNQVTIPYYTSPVSGLFFAMDYFYYIQDNPKKNQLYKIDPNKPQAMPSAWSLFFGALFRSVFTAFLVFVPYAAILYGFIKLIGLANHSGPDSESNIQTIRSHGGKMSKQEVDTMAKNCQPPPDTDKIQFTWGINGRNFVFYDNKIVYTKGITEVEHANIKEPTLDCIWRPMENPIEFSGQYQQIQTAATLEHLLYISDTGSINIWTLNSGKWTKYNSDLSSTSGVCIFVPRMVNVLQGKN